MWRWLTISSCKKCKRVLIIFWRGKYFKTLQKLLLALDIYESKPFLGELSKSRSNHPPWLIQAQIQDFEMGGEFFLDDDNATSLKHGNEAFLDYMLDSVFIKKKKRKRRWGGWWGGGGGVLAKIHPFHLPWIRACNKARVSFSRYLTTLTGSPAAQEMNKLSF